MLDSLFHKSIDFVRRNNLSYKRYFIKVTDFKHRLSIIQGPRGIGKSTAIAQLISMNEKDNDILYVSMDDIRNTSQYTMLEIAEQFELYGGRLLCFDEIHKYPNWSAELKNIYDTNSNLKVIATGSSALEIHKGSHDLTRRAIVYNMFGMSFREFLELHYHYQIDIYSLEDILERHIDISTKIITKIESKEHKVLSLFKEYLKFGYYPYYLDIPEEIMFFQTLQQNINTTIESDLINIYPNLSGVSIRKIKMLLAIIMQSVPFTPKISDLKKNIGVKDDRTLKEYLSKLDNAGLISMLMKTSLSMKAFDKPEKIYMANTNLMYIGEPEKGSIRETFFMNQLQNYYCLKDRLGSKGVYSSNKGDFLLAKKHTIEVGGKNKTFNQIKDINDSYIASDDIEYGYKNKIPLWLFGLLY